MVHHHLTGFVYRLYCLLFFLGMIHIAYAQHAVRSDFPNSVQKGTRFHHFTKEEWGSYGFASESSVKKWQDRRYGMFIHFGITSKANKDLSWGSIPQRYPPDAPSIMANGTKRTEEWTTWPADMRLEKFNAKEWVAIAKRAGFRYIVITTKHHEGFHMWDTKYSDFKITNTPFRRDYIKELTDACRAAGMPVGFYFAQREWYHPDYQPVDLSKVNKKGKGVHWTLKPGETSPMGPRHANYLRYLKNVVAELCTRYGKIDIWWWDAVDWGGMFTKEMWDAENMNRMIRKLQPGIVINNRASVPGDFDTPEGHLGAFQDWRAWESCIPISDAWCYTGKPAHSYQHLLNLLVGAACGNGNLLSSWGPHWDGAFDEEQKQRLFEIGDWLNLHGKAIYGTRGGPWKPAAWGGSTHKGNKGYIIFFQKPNESVVLPAIPKRKVVAAKILVNGKPVQFQQNEQSITLQVSDSGFTKGAIVIELTMSGSLDGIPSISSDK